MKAKQLLATLVIFCMVIAMLPAWPLPVKAAGAVTYNPALLEHPVIPAAIARNFDYLNLVDTRLSFFNHIRHFKSDSGSILLPNIIYTRLSGKYKYDLKTSALPTLGGMAAAGQLSVSYALSMQNDNYGVFSNKRQWQSTDLYKIGSGPEYRYSYKHIVEHTGVLYPYEDVRNYGSASAFESLEKGTTRLELDFDVGVNNGKGDANIRDLTLYVADRLAPTLTGITYTDSVGNAKTAFKAGETVTIVLTFSENIRFSDNSANHADVKLALNVAKRSTHSTNVTDQYAVLTGLTDNMLTFSYTVPSSIDGYNTDHIIIGIKKISSQTTWYGSSHEAFKLIYPFKNKPSYLPAAASEPDYGYNTTHSLITDLAGNPVASFGDKDSAYCYIDNVAPLINNVTVDGNMITNEPGERSPDAIYAGVGDWLKFKAWFSEKVNITGDVSDITATLNITISDGSTRAVLSGAEIGEENNMTTVTFDKLDIKAGMKPLASGDVKFITLESIALSNVTVTDPAGNAFTGQVLRENDIFANNQEKLDTLAPTVTTTTNKESDGSFTPFYFDEGASVTRIYFPITVEDNNSHGDDYVSGVNGATGSFVWQSSSDFKFDYCVTSTENEPESGWETTSANAKISFQQVVTTSGGNYIHFRPSTGNNIENTSLLLYPVDYAGNISPGVTFPLNYILDITGPVVTRTSLNTYSDPITELGFITAGVNITDSSTVNASAIEYQWVRWGGNTAPAEPDASDPGWAAYSSSGLSDDTNVDLSLTLSDLEKGVPHRYTLFIKASDRSAAGIQTSITGLECSFDLGYPDFKINPSTAPAPQVKMSITPPGDEGGAGYAVIMVKDPWGDGSKYFVRRIATGETEYSFKHDLFSELYYQNGLSTQMYDWIYCTVSEDVYGSGFVFADPITVYDLMFDENDVDSISTAKRLLAIMGTSVGAAYYGDVDVTVITGYGDLTGDIPSAANVLVQDFTLKSAYPGANYVQGKEAPADAEFQLMIPYAVHTVTLNSDGENLHPESTWTNPGGGAKYLSSMDGIILRVDIANILKPSWGVSGATMDGIKSRIELYLISSPDEGGGNILKWWAPLTGTSQTFSIPSSAFTESGKYELRATVCSVGYEGFDQYHRFDIASDFIYIDGSSPDFDCGLVYSSHDYTYLSHKINHQLSYNYDQDLIYLGEQDGKSTSLVFGIDNCTAKKYDNDHAFGETFIRVWNSTQGNETRGSALWHSFPVGKNSILSYEISFADAIAVTDTAGRPALCLLSGRENTVCYQVATTKGYLSQVYTVTINAGTETAEFDMALTPETSDELLHSAIAYVKELSGSALTGMTVNELIITGDTAESVPLTSDTITLTDKNTHHYYVTNLYGNFSFDAVQAYYVDTIAPQLYAGYFDELNYSSYSADPGNTYNTVYIDLVDDRIFDPVDMQLYLKLNDPGYMTKLKNDYGLELNDQGYFRVDLPSMPASLNDSRWTASSASKNGIWKIEMQRHTKGGNPCIRFYICIRKLYEDGGSNLNTTLSAYAVDKRGNISKTYDNIANIRLSNQQAGFSSYAVDVTGQHLLYRNVSLNFNSPVLVTSPSYLMNGADSRPFATNEYSYIRPSFTAWGGGSYSITYQDVFGEERSEIVMIDNSDFNGLGLDVTYSEAGPSQEDIVVNISTTNPNAYFYTSSDLYNLPVTITLPDGTPVYIGVECTKAVLTFKDNADILFYVCNSEDWTDFNIIQIPVHNIVARAPDVNVSYYYHEFCMNELPEGKTSTKGLVTAYISSADAARSITGIDCSLEYTFPYGTKEGDSYTFTYSDSYGNIREKVVACPVNIVVPDEPEEDTLAPTFDVRVYGSYNSIYQKLETWYGNIWVPTLNEAGEIVSYTSTPSELNSPHAGFIELLQSISYTSGYKLEFKITDASRTKLVLLAVADDTSSLTYDCAESADIQSVTITGNWITVFEGAGAFKAAIIDEKDNITCMDFAGGWLIDTTAPVIEETAKVKLGYTKAHVFLRVTDSNTDPANTIIVMSPTGLFQIESTNPDYGEGGKYGTYTGWYFYEYTANETVDFKFRDTAYNMISKPITISDLDFAAPKSEIAWWSPSAPNDTKIAPTAMTNRNVSVGLDFDKMIKELNLTFYDGTDYVPADVFGSEPAIVSSLSPTSAVITFTSGASVRATYTAFNGTTGTRDITLGEVIDKEAPTINVIVEDDIPTKTSATISLRPNEDVYDTFGKLRKMGEDITHTVFTRGTYDYTFTDLAGNVTTISPSITNIDEFAPALLFDNLPDPTGPNYYTRDSVTFKVAMNEPGSIDVDGVTLTNNAQSPIDSNSNGEIEIDEWDWHTVTVSRNGSYGITATDLARRKTTYYVGIDCIDNTAPVITLTPSTFRIRQETPLSELTNAILLSGVAASDNVSLASNLVFGVTNTISQDNLNSIGLYEAKVTVTDEAGNIASAIRYIKVYSKSETDVRINGIKADNGGTTSVSGTTTVNIQIDLPAAFKGEPYTVFYRAGIKTMGQMKNNPTVLAPDVNIADSYTFTAPADGFYTIYIVRQGREVFLTKIYVQQ